MTNDRIERSDLHSVQRDILLSRFGGDWDVLAAVVDVFLVEYAEQLAAIEQSIADQDAAALAAQAHRLRGSVSVFGAEAAAQEALRLELAGAASTQTGVAEAFHQLTLEVEQLGHDLRHIRAQRTAA